jgi:hypothetical protein
MGRGSYARTSFLGGEWSKTAQGRADKEEYVTAMDKCFNALPVEQGACTRRPGTIQLGTTRNGVPGVIRSFDFLQSVPYLMEFTPGFMRLHSGAYTATENEQAITVVTPNTGPPISATITTSAPHGWSVGEQVQVRIIGALAGPLYNVAPLLGRQFIITAVPTTSSITIVDSIFGTFDATTVVLGTNDLGISRVVEFTVPYQSADLTNLRVVQNDTYAFILCAGYPALVLQQLTPPISDSDGDPVDFATFSLTTAVFTDGPYLDPPTDGSTVSAGSSGPGSVTLTWSSTNSINNGQGFTSADVGRFVRLFSQPLPWVSTTAYAVGQTALYQGSAFTASAASTNEQPDINPLTWTINPTGLAWTYGPITAVSSNNVVVVDIVPSYNDAYGNPQASGALLYGTTPMSIWQLGVYTGTTQPAVGTFHEGRVWFSGALPNRFDSSMSDLPFQFSPTDLYGNVADNNGISETLEASEVNAIFWMIPYHESIVMGTQAGEWAIQASALSDPLTPTSIQAHRRTKYGCENVDAVMPGMSVVFVRRYAKKLTELVSDVYSGKITGMNLSQNAEHLSDPSGIAQIAYVQETTPIIWSRMNDGTLASMTYRRDSPFGTQAASFFAWAPHALGTGRTVLNIQSGPAPGGEQDALSLLTQDPATSICYIEIMTNIFLETDTIENAWFVDGGGNTVGADILTVGGVLVIQLYGFWYVVGETISAFINGVDCGDFTVQANGTIQVPASLIGL